MSGKMISSEACRKYAEICKFRHSRLLNIQESALFESLEKVCLQAAQAAEAERDSARLEYLWNNYETAWRLYNGKKPFRAHIDSLMQEQRA